MTVHKRVIPVSRYHSVLSGVKDGLATTSFGILVDHSSHLGIEHLGSLDGIFYSVQLLLWGEDPNPMVMHRHTSDSVRQLIGPIERSCNKSGRKC